MKEMTSVDKLDAVLKIIASREKSINPISFTEITQITNTYIPPISASELERVLNKLDKDGFIDTEPLKINPSSLATQSAYKITFEGASLLEIDFGYAGRLATQNESLLLGKKNQKHLRLGAIWAAIGATGYLIWDIIKFLYEHPHIFCCHH